MTNAIQVSTRRGDDILVIGGADVKEFTENLFEVLGPEKASQLSGEFPDFFPDGTERAVATLKQAFPNSATIFGFRGTHGENGWVTDKWGNEWSDRLHDEAPPCQCGNNNRGKLAIKKGTTKAGKQYTGWFCANGYESKDGCAAVFNPPGKQYPA